MFLNLILFTLSFIFFLFLSFFLYNGSNIFELVTFSNFDFIYNKINGDVIEILKKSNSILTYVIPINRNYIYKTNTDININSLNSELYFTQNNTLYKLNIYKDISKIIPIISNLNKSFKYIPYET